MKRVFIDMDGVLADFAALKRKLDMDGDRLKNIPGAFAHLQPIPGALEAVHSLIGMGFEVWIATKPPTGNPGAYADKAAWILHHLPELKRRIIMTHNKGLLHGDYLIDDRVHKASCEAFTGTLIRFGQIADESDVDVYDYSFQGWPEVLEYMRLERDKPKVSEPPQEWPELFGFGVSDPEGA